MRFIISIIFKLVLYQFITVKLSLGQTEVLSHPVIKVLSEDWLFLTPYSVISEISATDPGQGSQLTLSCSAQYPIKWRVTGYQGREIFRTGETKTEIGENGTWIYTIETWNAFPTPASVKILCVHFKDTSVVSSLSVFVSDKTSVFLKNSTQRYPISNKIPCASTDPRVSILLFKRTVPQTRTGIVSVNARYEATEGFILDQHQEGEFICRAREETKDIILEDPDKNNPKAETVGVWLTDEVVHLHCNTSTGEIVPNLKKMFESNQTLLRNSSKTDIVLDGRFTGNSSFSCQNKEGTRKRKLYYWFLEAPTLRFNTRMGEIDCISESVNKTIAGVRCENRNDCFLMRSCFQDEKCRNDRQTYFAGEIGDRNCYSGDLDYSCISIRTTFFNGLIECGVAGGLRNTIYEFFTGLLLIKYKSWFEAPREELIRMDEVPSVLYANNTSYFFCEAVAFLFSDSFHYSISYENGSTTFLKSEAYTQDDSEKSNRRKVQDFNVISGINISLPVGATEVTCHNTLADEPRKFSVSRKFVVKYLKSPEVDKSNGEVTLTRGIEGRLICKAKGEPLPEIKIYKIEDSNSTLKHVKRTTDGDGILDFPKVDSSISGEYLCIAENSVAKDSFTFKVTVAEPRETTLYWIIFGTITLICILIVTSFFFWRQQKFARDLLRQLTEDEINEFLNGNNDMWLMSLNSQNKQENIHYMPYNNEYEIPITKLELDETSLLGSGEYGMIVRASYDCNIVAVKTTKPLADILYFKALLSELKVMMFIGEQENIVRLIGACTENIRDRKIYIVFELCSLGNLEHYLRENKEFFVEEDKLEIKTEPETRVMTTSDFMKWSYEVACAMEWLSIKKVVHADLATRNILLAENKVAKLSDFGLSLKLYQDTNYVKRKQVPLPFRWMAPEGLRQFKFSTESDVWSYGVTVWEIFSMGDVPFPGEVWNYDFVRRLTNDGLRLEKPKYCPESLYDNLLMACWKLKPEERPSFAVLKASFYKIMNPNLEAMYTNTVEIGDGMYENPTEDF